MEKMFIPFSVPDIGDEEVAEVVDTLRSGWLTTGPKVRRFEEEFARYVGARHAVAVNSCTAALHLALDAVGVGRGDMVVTTPMTFAATAEVIRYFGARPVFVDIDEETLNISPQLLEDALKALGPRLKKVKAVVPVHMAGQPCMMDELIGIAGARGIKVIEDAAHTLPARYKGRMAGTMGDIGAYSFYATKCITTGEGGMAVTDDSRYAERMRVMSLHGISRDAWKRYSKDGTWKYEILYPGYKYNMPDVAAAIGLCQLKKADALLKRRAAIAAAYADAFRDLPGISLPSVSREVEHSWHLFIIMVDDRVLTVGRDAFIEELKALGVLASVHFIPLHMHPYYRDRYGYKASDFPAAAAAYSRTLSLPLYPKMDDDEVRYVVECVKSVALSNLAGGRPRPGFLTPAA